MDSPSAEPPMAPGLEVELAQVSVTDGIWNDTPDPLAAFDEARLGAPARGKLFLLLDVSGGVEGRAEVERDLVETIRREYAGHRGSISFGLSEALRSANLRLLEINRTASREARRMAGVCAVVLRGQELYLAHAGPGVIYVETAGSLKRYPEESDWFTEDQPIISPQGNASAPLGVRREFTCDFFHVSTLAGDVCILATRGLTQLAGTDELAQAIADRGAEDIANHIEELANGVDLTALVVELVDPRDIGAPPSEKSKRSDRVVELNTDAEVVGHGPVDEPEMEEPELEPEFEPALAEAEPPDLQFHGMESAGPTDETPTLKREERRRKRKAQLGSMVRVGSGLAAGLLALVALLGVLVMRVVGLVNWKRFNEAVNRTINSALDTTWRFLALFVRMTLPGTPAKVGLAPRRASKEPVWLQAAAVLIPLAFVGLATGIYEQQQVKRDTQAADLVRQASDLEQAAEKNPDKTAARNQFTQALAMIRTARETADSQQARGILFKIQDQLNELNGVAVLYYLPSIAAPAGDNVNLTQIIAVGGDVYLLDHGGQRVLHYVVNDSATQSDPTPADGVILKAGDKVGDLTVDQIRDLVWVDAKDASSKPQLVAVTGNAFLMLASGDTTWRAQTITDSAQWGSIRAAAGYGGNVYLLDPTKNQIWKYVGASGGFASTAVPYLPANSGVDLVRAIDLAIDGEVWAMTGDGTIFRFRGGQRVPFALNGLEIGLKNPTAIFTSPGVDAIYVADAGNQRFVQFDKNGQFVRQFKPPAEKADIFNSLKGFYADDTGRKFFFISGKTAYATNVPK